MRFLALVPVLAILLTGPQGLDRVAGPEWVAAALRTLLLAEASTGLALPVGSLAAFGLWSAPRGVRRFATGIAVLTLLLPAGIVARGLGDGLPGLVAAQAAGAACVVLLVMTSRLNTLDPRIRQAAANAGAAPWRAWRLVVLPNVAWHLAISAAAAMSFAVGQAALERGHATLGVLAMQASGPGSAEAASAAFLLLCLAGAPLLIIGVLSLVRPRQTPCD